MKPVPMLSAWSQRLLSELESADGRAERLARGLTREQFNWNPRPGGVEHWPVSGTLADWERDLPARDLKFPGGQATIARSGSSPQQNLAVVHP